jgi:hypothetical protein
LTEPSFGLKPERPAADTAYGWQQLDWIIYEKEIAPHIPVIDKSKRTVAYLALDRRCRGDR